MCDAPFSHVEEDLCALYRALDEAGLEARVYWGSAGRAFKIAHKAGGYVETSQTPLGTGPGRHEKHFDGDRP